MRFVSNHVAGRFESLLAGHGVSTTERVAMRTLYDQSDSTLASFIRELDMTWGAVSKVVTRREGYGWVDPGPCRRQRSRPDACEARGR